MGRGHIGALKVHGAPRQAVLSMMDGGLNMNKVFSLTTIALAAFVGAVHPVTAADLPSRPAYAPAPIMSPVPVYNWTGIYVGLNGGYGWGSQDPLNIITNRFDGASLGFSGGVFGGTVGAQIQSGHVVIGFEADLDWAGMKGSGTIVPTNGAGTFAAVNATTNIDWESTARVRVGYANQNWLFYATGGMAILGAKTSLTTTGGASCTTLIATCTGLSKQIGAALGAGVEYGITENVSAKLEYLYITAASLDVSHHSEIRAGLNYRFGGL
jgi:outer membrane immunogenic protein